MIRMARLTDYGIVLMRYVAAHPERSHNAAEIATGAHLPVPTVSKLLRVLAREGLLVSHRGAKGGYELAQPPVEISLWKIIAALEGPVSMTVCTSDSPEICEHESLCPVQGHWQKINRAIRQALDGISLAEMASPLTPQFMTPEGPTPAPLAAQGQGRP
jgi:FeS assembly SUF system regulator